MYDKILVPIDGSPTAQRGLAEAIALAKLTHAKLRLLHVVDELSLALGAGDGTTYSPDFVNVLREAGHAILNRAAQQASEAGIEADTLLDDSFAARVSDTVVARAKEWGADLIVLGTHGRRGVRRLVVGSDAENIVRLAPVPVLLVRGDAVAG